jgi:hypothetical protein
MIVVNWLAAAVGLVAAMGLGFVADTVHRAARSRADRVFACGLVLGALVLVGLGVSGVALRAHGFTSLATAAAVTVLSLGSLVLAAFPGLLSAAAQP